jgi:hypothetical protein
MHAAPATAQLLGVGQAFGAAVPLLHAAALLFTLPSGSSFSGAFRRRKWAAWPLAGGVRCFVLQLLSWTFFAMALLVALPPWLACRRANPAAAPAAPEHEVLAAVFFFSAATSMLFMLKSILVFDPQAETLLAAGAGGHLWSRFQTGRAELHWDVSRLPNRRLASTIVAGLGVAWAGMGAALLLAAEQVAGGALR